ncbi:pyoverdine biosynthesis protein PvcA [Legionella steigerwaltii]|uniref:Pyoverdine biosynthesis protein PvcA n=1 Tax=Legionella steigerwaltii TaxID=460 RepID=A0A378LCJ9_9GAMM|nr:isocyanide synthase family protein [Legionella steigerwaltii]KTD78020.1 pyoverdine biosynthesis protein PvcA [Legionella steigerwaltii]STY24417.1 pyoverdine biosynthesis protein PvcA [Legionella steigerwaltii]
MKNTAFTLITENHYTKDYALKKSLNSDSSMEVAKRILAEVMIFRRVPEAVSLCGRGCSKCASPHLPNIISAVKKSEPVTFILPAFPGKSPNPEKVLGPLPDHAERLSLIFLGTLCQKIKEFYTPGIKIILCSDGRVFSDVIGMQESNVTAYHVELDRLIKEMSLSDISIFNLDYFYKGLHYTQMRDELMKSYGQSLEFLKLKVRNGAKPSASSEEQEANRMYSGITRFLFEDAMHAGQTKSRSAIQKESRAKAYEVIRRSNAWSTLIFEHFPGAVRLSIHPQTCGSKKLGVRLIGNESWMTPWHGVAVESKKGYVLLKRSEAEALGAKLIYSADGRHSHYQLMAEV